MAAATPAASEVRVDVVENDDVIAYALQEELAQVAMAYGGEAEHRATVLAQQWFHPEVVRGTTNFSYQHRRNTQ